MRSQFVQIHFLSAWPGVLLNRDDAGFAKRLPFGGATRTRVSSQCLKRHWRMFEGAGGLGELNLPATVRSRETFERRVVSPLVEEGMSLDRARSLVTVLRDRLLGKSDKAADKAEKAAAKKGGAKANPLFAAPEAVPAVHTEQVTVLGHPEIQYLIDIARKANASGEADATKAIDGTLGKEGLANLKQLQMAAGLGAALFGRMVTSDILARGDAAVHVAHAFTVHKEESETDYFSAVDDLSAEDGQLGSGHIGNVELTSGLFYGYVVIDVPLLVSNLTGVARKQWETADRATAGAVVSTLLRLIATVTPGAKLGSTAPYTYAQAVLVEVGSAQPRTLANAFHKPVAAKSDVLGETYKALGAYLSAVDSNYATGEQRRVLAMGAPDGLASELKAEPASLAALCAWAEAAVAGAP
jgi:CRISPR system Cascade subunit CasC